MIKFEVYAKFESEYEGFHVIYIWTRNEGIEISFQDGNGRNLNSDPIVAQTLEYEWYVHSHYIQIHLFMFKVENCLLFSKDKSDQEDEGNENENDDECDENGERREGAQGPWNASQGQSAQGQQPPPPQQQPAPQAAGNDLSIH